MIVIKKVCISTCNCILQGKTKTIKIKRASLGGLKRELVIGCAWLIIN